MRNKLIAIFLFSPLLCFGLGGMADAFYDFQRWVYPAYLTNLIIGLCIFIFLALLSWKFRIQTDRLLTKTSDYLKSHRLTGVLVAGILLAIPLGIALSVLCQLIGLMSIIVFIVIICAFPFILALGKFRNKLLINKNVLKWECIFAISAILASVIFIALIEFKLLPFSEDSISARSYSGLYRTSHPWDSLEEIWLTTGFLIIEIIISLILVLIGNGIRCLYRKFKHH